MIKFLETLINGEGRDLNLHNNHTLVYCALPDNLLQLHLNPQSFFAFRWVWYIKWWLGLFQRATQFSWVSHIYMEGIHVIKFLFVFLVLICLLSRGWGGVGQFQLRP